MTVDLTDVPERLRVIVATTLEAAGVDDGHVSVELVGERRIRELNRLHRDRDEATDVLSFPIDGDRPSPGPRELGDVIVCPPRTEDVTEAVIHGVLHLCGYDHESDDGEMLVLQERVLADLDCDPATPARREEIAASLDAEPELFGAFDELFADLEELGASAGEIAGLLERAGARRGERALDLGCGKGAVAVELAGRLGLEVLGVDAVPGFVEAARRLARRAGVQELCRFQAGDLRHWLEPAAPFDVVLLLALGDLLGDAERTVRRVRSAVRPGGLIVIDDGYLAPGAATPPGYEAYAERAETRRRLESRGDRVLAEEAVSQADEAAENRRDTERLRRRAADLARDRPDLAPAVERFIAAQEAETRLAETSIVGAVWVLERAP